MTDRVPLYPGRVSLSPVSGQDNVFDLVMADGAVIGGTPLNKATFLKDQTAALFGLGASALPDDVFSAIASGYAKIEIANYTGTGTFGVNNPSSITFSFAPKMVFAISVSSLTGPGFTQLFGTPTSSTSGARFVMTSDSLLTTYSAGKGFTTGASGSSMLAKKSEDGKTFFWYGTDYTQASAQLNTAGVTYHYVAIG